MTAEASVQLIYAGWRLLLRIMGAGHIGVGTAWLINGPGWLTDNPTFSQVDNLPWWLWGVWAIASGTLIIWTRTALAGLAATACWYAVWTALLVPQLLVGGPYYPVGVYLTLTAVHVLVTLVEGAHVRLDRG